MLDLQALINDVRGGLIPATIYSDPELFELEKRLVFGRAWLYLAHESEIPQPGDYVVRRIVDDSFIVCRDEDGAVRVLFNMCLHRGMQLCRSERGNTSHFRCPYHAWTYKNSGELTGVPFHKDAYGGEEGLRREGVGLLPAPRVESYAGLIFASLAEEGPSLEEYLGGFRFYLDFYLRQSERGVEVRGPQRFIVKANLWQPVSATETEVFSWFAVDQQAPQWYKDASYKAYLMCFGSSGMFEQDDASRTGPPSRTWPRGRWRSA